MKLISKARKLSLITRLMVGLMVITLVLSGCGSANVASPSADKSDTLQDWSAYDPFRSSCLFGQGHSWYYPDGG